jgi:hypothetical protein
MKIQLLLLAGFIGTGVIIGSIQRSDLRHLRQQNAALRGQAAESRALAEKIAAMEQVEVDWDELDRLQLSRNELARLRGSISLIRQADQLVPEQAQAEIKSMLSEAQTMREQVEQMRQKERSEKLGKEAEQALGQLLVAARDFSRTQGRLPYSFQEMRALHLSHGQGKSSPLERQHRFFGSVEEFFEFVPNISTGNPAGTPELLFREKEPRPHPNGGWVRLYGLSNIHVEEVILPENRFAEWEQAIGQSAASQP